MLQLDAVQLYDLSEAGKLLYRDPVRLAREARLGRIPAARVGPHLGLPAPWVDAEAGTSPSDPGALCVYWRGRLAPPSPDANRPRRPRDRLPVDPDGLLEAAEAARRVTASPAALRRLDADGTLPSLRVDGRPLYDALLVDGVAREHEGAEMRRQAEARRLDVLDWGRFEYESRPVAAAAAPTEAGAAPEPPGAYEIPADLGLGSIEPLAEASPAPPSTLIEAEGYETVDED